MAIPLMVFTYQPPVVRKTHPTKNFGDDDLVDISYHSASGAQSTPDAAARRRPGTAAPLVI
jgi:hypothetical protein